MTVDEFHDLARQDPELSGEVKIRVYGDRVWVGLFVRRDDGTWRQKAAQSIARPPGKTVGECVLAALSRVSRADDLDGLLAS